MRAPTLSRSVATIPLVGLLALLSVAYPKSEQSSAPTTC